ncbi:MAG: hypothetical protein V1676_05950 [Candidatus Diapherotrites archaeon]
MKTKTRAKSPFSGLIKAVRRVRIAKPFTALAGKVRGVKLVNPVPAIVGKVAGVKIANPVPAIAKRARKIKVGKLKVANLFAFAFALIMLSVFVSAVPFGTGDVAISADNSNIELGASASAGVALTIQNLYEGRACVELRTESNYDGIYAVLPKGEFCLAKGQSTKFAMHVNAKDWAGKGAYAINVIMGYRAEGGERGSETEASGTFTEKMKIKVNVKGANSNSGSGSAGSIGILPEQGMEFCKDSYTKEISVYIENNTAKEQHITLSAVSEMFLPSFGENELWLGAWESEEVTLKININRTTAAGYYYVPLYAQAVQAQGQAKRVYSESTVGFGITECSDEAGRPFELSVDAVKYDVEKGAQVSIGFTVKNLLGEKQDIRLSSTGDLPNSLKSYGITLQGGKTYSGKITVKAGETDKTGWHEIALYAWNAKGEEKEFVQVNVGRMHDMRVEVKNNGLEERACSAQDLEVFEIVFSNKGDYEEHVSLHLDNPYETISHDISDSYFGLGIGESKSVYVSVVPGYDAEIGNYEITLHAKAGGGFNEEYELKFRVVEDAGNAGRAEGVLEISGYAGNVSIAAGQEKTLEFTIKNNSAETVENITIRLWGLGNGVYFPTTRITSIAPFGSATVSGRIYAAENALPREYDATLEAKGEKYIATAGMRINVRGGAGGSQGAGSGSTGGNSTGQGGGNGWLPAGITGFLNLANPAVLGAGLAILMLLTIIYLVLLLGSNKKTGYGLPRRIMVRAR